MLPSTRQRLQAPLTRPSPWTALAGRAAGTPRSSAPGPAWTGSQIQDPRRPSLGGLGPAPAGRLPWRPAAGLRAPGESDRRRHSASGTQRSGLLSPHLGAWVCEPVADPSLRPPARGSHRVPAWAAGRGGIGLRGVPRVRRGCRRELPLLASGPRAAAAATALSLHRPRRPPPRARPLAPPRPEPPPGPRRRRRPSVRFVFPSLAVPAFVCRPPLGPRASRARSPRGVGRPVGPLRTKAGTGAEGPSAACLGEGTNSGGDAWGVTGRMALLARPLRQ